MRKYELYIQNFEEVPADPSFLDAGERDRYHRLIHPQKKNEFLKGRVFIKQMLGEYLNIPPRKLSISISPNGRPFLSVIYGEQIPFFNLAHTDGVFALGISDSFSIGVDIEPIRPINVESLRLFFSQNERQILEKIENSQSKKILELFVLKEAFIKATDKKWGLDEISFLLKDNDWVLNQPQKEADFFLEEHNAYLTAVCLCSPF